MLHVAAVVATSILGIDAGWQPLPDGGVEYIIQIAPQTFEVLKPGDLVQSRVPAEVKDIRQCRVVIGRGPLPRQLPPEQTARSPLPSFPAPGAKHPAGHPALGTVSDQSGSSAIEPAEPAEQHDVGQAAGTWWPTVAALVALFASLGANVYLGWLTWDLHRRCQAAAKAESAPAEQPDQQS